MVARSYFKAFFVNSRPHDAAVKEPWNRLVRARRFSASSAGNAAVEFALVMPLFLTLLLGIVAFGFYFTAAHATQQLAANAARAAMGGLTWEERETLARNYISVEGGRYALIRQSALAVNAHADTLMPGIFEVRVVLDASYLPIWFFDGLVPLPARTIERSAFIQRGGY